ncbi:cAMP-dependent protein kinase type II regulatory chain [Sporisorium reilianum SRZ2]|uniref:cAMP-dependent protein kinase regulatory subunit n=1 Tax=Sporisorium reilianum (strain SRZ2) TaxID=999809 RepID=E6ZWM4_SPORE|nr:cAMP-dependent protein kinase type II regulatory chain [Sporisorium reilianum SRZ2]
MSLPANTAALLNDLHRDVARARPADPLQFCANWFSAKLEEQRRQHLANNLAFAAAPASSQPLGPSDVDFGGVAPGLASPTQRASLFNTDPFAPPAAATAGAAAAAATAPAPSLFNNASASAPVPMDASQSPDSTPAPAPPTNFPPSSASTSISNAPLIPPTFNLGRRTSVSAESMAPSAANAESDGSPLPKTVIPKSEEQMQRIRGSIGNNLLFRNLEQDQYRDVLLAMKEVKVDADVTVIEQGAQGDYFYVVESGALDVYVRSPPRNGEAESTTSALGDKKVSYGPGSSFGELALLYAQPRAATVLSTSPCTLWALDRITFRSILMETNSRRRALYEKFLMDVPLFERLSAAERAKISDSLELREYAPGEAVITQGERGSEFFIIVEGDAEVRKTKEGAHQEVVGKLSRGDYFGELALLNNAPRAATVAAAAAASATKLRVVTMSERAFTRLLGPLAGILERHAKETYGDEYSMAGHVNANAATSVNNGALAGAAGEVDVGNAFPHPMDSSAKPGEGAWSAPNPFAAA